MRVNRTGHKTTTQHPIQQARGQLPRGQQVSAMHQQQGHGNAIPVITPGQGVPRSYSSPNIRSTSQNAHNVGRTVITAQGNVVPGTEGGKRK